MTWEEMLLALQSLDRDACLRMREPGDWYTSLRIEVGGDGFLAGLYGNGSTPRAAVIDAWDQLVEKLPAGKFLVVDAGRATRREVRWNGFMWKDIEE